jgi:GT2 family glycosyltransferase/glycosyltransferase involved in cell wall biosynthesis
MQRISDVDVRRLSESGEFDPQWYAQEYPDVGMLDMSAAEHYLQFGRLLGRPGRSDQAGESLTELARIDRGNAGGAANDQGPASVGKRPRHWLLELTDQIPNDPRYPISNFFYYIWTSRLDLQQVFDLRDPASRVAYCEWFLLHGGIEYGIGGWAYPLELLTTFASCEGEIGQRARELIADSEPPSEFAENAPAVANDGANLIGYARGEFGMGEHVRAVAEALDSVGGEFSIINVPEAGVHGENERRVEAWISDRQDHATNLFHINADILPSLYGRFGPQFFEGRYNIGYWAWELANCPPEFATAMSMVDEVWGISDFVTESFRQISNVPVVNMPLAVELPPIKANFSKSYFGIDEEEFVYLFTFDAASYLERKNPLALIRAFLAAFPRKSEKVRLLLKTMNIPTGDPRWGVIAKEAARDHRITILDRRLDRDEVLGLYVVCDAFVSLHRSEGFGRCLTEAMLLGKPVVATGYSGSDEFIRHDTACVVDYKLIPVEKGSYPFWQNQIWADPDVEHAASHMRRLFEDQSFRSRISRAGQTFVRERFNPKVIGARYLQRLEQIKVKRLGWQRSSSGDHEKAPKPSLDSDPISQLDSKEIIGSLDLPLDDPKNEIHGKGLQLAGWVTGGSPVEKVTVRLDDDDEMSVHYGIIRPDIAAAHPGGVDAGRSGFSSIIDLEGVARGEHSVTVQAKTTGGGAIKWTRKVRIGDPADIYKRWKAVQKAQSDLHVSFILICSGPSADELLRIQGTVDSIARQAADTHDVILVSDRDITGLTGDLVWPAHVRLANVTGSLRAATEAAAGEFVCVLHSGDQLSPGALAAVTMNLASCAEADLLYGDEEVLSGEGVPLFKPGWSPTYLQQYNYIGRPFFLRGTIAQQAFEVAGREDKDEYALLCSVAPLVRKVVHVPAVMAVTKPTSRELRPLGTPVPPSGGWPGISVIIPTRLGSLPLVDACFRGLLERTDYPNLEVIVVANNMPDRSRGLKWMEQWPFRVVEWHQGYNWSALNNLGVRHAKHELVLLLNDDVEPVDPSWLKEMVAALSSPHVGCVGALLTYPNGSIQHAGMNLGRRMGETHHTHRLHDPDNPQLAPLVTVTREQTMVTGACLLTQKEHYEAVGGCDESIPIVCNDADLCFKIADLGLTHLLAGRARLIHYEGISRFAHSEAQDVVTFRKRWAAKYREADSYMNINLDLDKSDGSINPEAKQSWIGRVFTNNYFKKDFHERTVEIDSTSLA